VQEARNAGCTVVDATSVLATHLAEVIRRCAHELFSRQDAKKVLDRVSEEHPRLIEDPVPKLLPLATVQRVLQNLLRERVSIRDAASILEALGEAGAMTKNPVLLTEYVRQAIRRMVMKPYLNSAGYLPAYFVDPSIEPAIEHGEFASHCGLSPQAIRDLLERIHRAVGAPDGPVAAVTSSGARYFLRQVTENSLANVFFLSHNEIPPDEGGVAGDGAVRGGSWVRGRARGIAEPGRVSIPICRALDMTLIMPDSWRADATDGVARHTAGAIDIGAKAGTKREASGR
jgi:flagellar biosynthesis protein FlhA